MKKKIITLLSCSVVSLFLTSNIYAQVGISNVDPKAKLDISASSVTSPINTDGILIPRVDEYPASPTASQDGMMVYLTGGGTPAEGFYYWDGSKWLTIDGGNNWGKSGNTGTTTGIDFIGTTDAQALSFFTNNAERLRISQSGYFKLYTNGTNTNPVLTWNADSNTGIYRIGDDILGFATNGTERMRIDSNGDIGINQNTLLAKLHITLGTTTKPGIYSNLSVSNSNWAGGEFNNPNTAGGTGTFSSGYYAVFGNPTEPITGWAGYFNGDVVATSYWVFSEKRFKKNILELNSTESIIDKIMLLEPKSYNWKTEEFPGINFNSEKTSFGFIAQDLKQIFPELVEERKSIPDPKIKQEPNSELNSVKGYNLVNYIGLIPVLTQGIQEQQLIIEEQNTKIEALEKALEKMQLDIVNLQKNN